jgi:hypothetical protein
MTSPAPAPDLALLGDDALYQLLHDVTEEVSRRNEDGVADLVRDALQQLDVGELDPVRVIWPTEEWENGWFYSCTATVIFADGSTEPDVDFFGTPVEDRLTELSSDAGALGRHHGLVVDLRTGDVHNEAVIHLR